MMICFVFLLCFFNYFILYFLHIVYRMRVVCTRFGFTTTVGIISGNPKHDRRTAAIIDAVKSQSKEPIEFIGVIGDQYAKKLTKQYASSSIGDKN
jgi:hypothetical protein